MVTLTPEARNRPPKRLLKIWLPSSVAVAWLVISIPGEEKKKKKRKSLSWAPKGDTNWEVICAHIELILEKSEPAAKPSKMRFLRSIGWLLVLISTPAWAFLKMSFSSRRPTEKNILVQFNSRLIILLSFRHIRKNISEAMWHFLNYLAVCAKVPLPPLKMQMPPSLPSWILFRLSVGLLSVLIHTPAMALSKISLSSMKPRPVILNSRITHTSSHTLHMRLTKWLCEEIQTWVVD